MTLSVNVVKAYIKNHVEEAKTMKKIILVGLVVLAVLISGCGGSTEETPTPEVEIEYVSVVSPTGEVAPAVWATVSAQTGGTVLEVLVEPGSEVVAGDLLIRLDPTDAQLAILQAEAALEAAQAQGDFEVLAVRERRLLRVHLSAGIKTGLVQLAKLVA